MEASNEKRPINEEQRDTKKIKLDEQESKDQVSKEPSHREKFKKMALCLTYCGKGYYGMQRNPQYPTIESNLMEALLKANIISQKQHDDPSLLKFQRAARTDKGVSAVCQVVSLKLPRERNPADMAAAINSYLPDDIRVVGVKRSTQSFNSKMACDARVYAYLFPTFALADKEQPFSNDYRVPEEKIEALNKVLARYKGHHNFHNYTSGKKPNDASANRYIISCECSPPFIREEGMEFAILRIKGQSFMIHQIRKMVGLAFAIVRGLVGIEVLNKAWELQRVDVPKAPGLGLILEEICYEHYNRKYANDGMHSALSWEEHKDTYQAFREKYIEATIIQTELEENSMKRWLETLPLHSFDYRNHDGPPLNDNQDDKKDSHPNGTLSKDLPSKASEQEAPS